MTVASAAALPCSARLRSNCRMRDVSCQCFIDASRTIRIMRVTMPPARRSTGLSQKTLQSARLLHRRCGFLVQVSATKPMETSSPMLGIGDPAPDFALMASGADSSQKLSDLRGSTVLVIFDSAHWDPVKEELAGMYAVGAGIQATIQIVSDGRPEIASLFGVRDTTALFVVD